MAIGNLFDAGKKMHKGFRVYVLAATVAGLIWSSNAHANDALERVMRDVAEEVKKFLKAEDRPLEVQIGEFEGFALLQSSAGTEISRVLQEAMQSVGVKVIDGAPHLVEGVNNKEIEVENERRQRLQGFRAVPAKFGDQQFESLAAEINTLVLDQFGNELAVLPVKVFGSAALQLAGVDTELPPNASEREREQKAIVQFTDPQTSVRGASKSIVSSSNSSDFGMEVLVKNGNSLIPRSASLVGAKNRAFVKLRRGEEYVVRIYNNAPYEIAVKLTVDGVNVFQLAEDENMRDSRILVQPETSATIPGWFRNLTDTNQFEIGAYQNSVSKQQDAQLTDIGLITAEVRASFNDDAGIPKPADEPTAGARGKFAVPPAEATVIGEKIEKNYERVKRDYGVLRSTINIRYET